jgi:hypothetical protein
VDRFDQGRHGLGGGELGNAVAEIENMADAWLRDPETFQSFKGLAADLFRAGHQYHRIEVALHSATRANPSPGLTEVDGPVDANRITTARGDFFQP